MKRLKTLLVLFLFLGLVNQVSAENAYKESALSWQKQAKDTRGAVVNVARELEKIGDKGNPDAQGLIADAKTWLGEGDKAMSQADSKFKGEEYEKASYDYNMAWQYYVKAATAGLNAKRILTGQ